MKAINQFLTILLLCALLAVATTLALSRPSAAQAQSPTLWEYKTVHNLAFKDPNAGFGAQSGISQDGSPATTKLLNDLGVQG